METLENDKLLCNLAFEEYVARKKILELILLKSEKADDTQKTQRIDQKINELRERANHLNILKLHYSQNSLEENTEKVK